MKRTARFDTSAAAASEEKHLIGVEGVSAQLAVRVLATPTQAEVLKELMEGVTSPLLKSFLIKWSLTHLRVAAVLRHGLPE